MLLTCYDHALDANGRYTEGTTANVSCAQGFQLYGASKLTCGPTHNFPEDGIRDKPIEEFRCIPSNESECFKHQFTIL